MTIHEIAEWLGGEVIGDNVENAPAIERVAKIEEADSGSLTFLANPKYKSTSVLLMQLLCLFPESSTLKKM